MEREREKGETICHLDRGEGGWMVAEKGEEGEGSRVVMVI